VPLALVPETALARRLLAVGLAARHPAAVRELVARRRARRAGWATLQAIGTPGRLRGAVWWELLEFGCRLGWAFHALLSRGCFGPGRVERGEHSVYQPRVRNL
jgi:hypothetical protein